MRQVLALLLALASTRAVAAPAAAPADRGSPDIAAELSGPPGRFTFTSYDSRQGLRNLATNALAQDAWGFLWVGSEDGLYRYDGRQFRRFGPEDGLPSSMVSALLVAPDGSVWVAGAGGVARAEGERFERVGADKGLPQAAVADLAASRDGAVWIASSAGLFRYEHGRAEAAHGWPAGAADAVASEPGGGVFATQGSRLLRMDAGGVKATWDLPRSHDRIDDIAIDRDGHTWLSAGRRLWVRRADDAAFAEVGPNFPMLAEESKLSLDTRGRLWASTVQGLFLCVGAARDEAPRWRHFTVREGFPEGGLKAVFEDREGSLWISGSGLFRLLGRGLWISYNRETGLSSEQAWSLHRDKAGTLWVGSNNGLMRATPQGWALLPGTQDRMIKAIASGVDGALLFGGAPFQLGVLEPGKRDVRWLGEAAGLSGPNKILAIQATSDGAVWLATSGAGLLRSRPGTWSFEAVQLPNGDASERLFDVLADSAGRIWVSGQHGLAMYDAGAWRRFTTADGLRDAQVTYLAARGNGQICFAYREPLGVSCLTPPSPGARPVFEHIDHRLGLSEGRVYSLGEDRLGRFWFGTGTGVDVMTSEGFEHYGLREGLPGEDCTARAFLADSEGDVWIGLSNGLARMLASAYRALPVPRTVLEQVRVADHVYGPGTPQPLEIAVKQNTVEFSFAGLSFVSEAQVEHQVRLVGLEDWHTSDAHTARYAALAPGEYRFEARARLGQGRWSAPASFSIVVLPAWWQKTWVRGLFLLGAIALIALVVRWRLRQIVRRNEGLEVHNAALARSNEALTRARQRIEAATAEIESEAHKMLGTASRQNEMASRQAAAIQQTNLTVKTIADASRAASERAGAVLEGARQSDEDSQAGRRAVDEAVAAMEQLAAQVAATADRMRSLAARNEKVTEIIDTVRELAERSNVLALNASLEAVRAGEHGRGFLVVAREMNQLAEQSKEAANRVRAQLTEIQKETEAAVAETLEGQRRAQAATAAASSAGTTIAGLTDVIREFAMAARQIADDAREQTRGVEETLKAFGGFAVDMDETLDGARQIEQIAANLNELSSQLAGELAREARAEAAAGVPKAA